MRHSRLSLLAISLLNAALGGFGDNVFARGEAIAYPTPRGMEPSPDYQVVAGGKPIFVYRTPAFSFATFAVTGDVDVEVRVQRPITRPVIRPLSRNLKPIVNRGSLRFHLPGPCKLAVEVDDDLHRPLFLFANTPEQNIPRSRHARYFEGGKIHEAGRIELKDNETVYLAGGAVVRGVIRAKGISGAKIVGPGILDGSTRTTQSRLVELDHCKNIEINGGIFLGSYGWTLVPRYSENIRVSDVKVLGWRDNDDGCDPDSSRHVTVDNSFFRTKDDCIAVKAHGNLDDSGVISNSTDHALDTDDVRVGNSIFWSSEWGHALTVGFAVSAPAIRNVVFTNCDIIKKVKGPALSIDNHDLGAVDGVRFENIRVEDGCDKLLAVKVAFSEYSADCPFEFFRNNPARKKPAGEEWSRVQQEKRSSQRGTVRNVLFKDIQIIGDRLPDMEIRGCSARNEVSDVVFQNIRFQDRAFRTPQEANLRIQYATGVRFEP